MRIPTYVNNKEFTHIPEHVRQDLETLDRECAIYTDHWIEEVGDFRHVRIDFTEEERDEFFRRSWAFELFLRAGSPALAAETPGIDDDVARDADSYSLHSKEDVARDAGLDPFPFEDGPYHCFAGFLGEHLEKLCCSRTDREIVIDLKGRERLLFEIRRTIETLTPTIRSFNKREQGLAPWQITCEDDVRDLLYVMLRPQVFDLTKEEAIPSKAGTHKIADLCSKKVPFLIELKWIGKKGTWKRIINEIYVDIQSYVGHPSSRNLFFVIVDSIRDIQDPRQVEATLTEVQTIGGVDVDIRAIVCEP